MSQGRINLHGTAVVLGTRGIVFCGPSGIGKSTLAFACLKEARRAGCFAALIADDQVFIEARDTAVIAQRPPSIAGLIEIRGSGIASIASIGKAVLHLAVRVEEEDKAQRLPPDDERLDLGTAGSLPLIRLLQGTRDPLAVIAALRPEFRGEHPF
ncbi:serine kinase of HPr protein (carbohydrate metabolism regulator) [Neorhizobium galegae]|uniref:HPr kinase/phosphorylase n=1 Tax=Neorhizobium galegae TaxID=399 RepID=UPI001AE2D00A|nr:serine kinase of HPr protein (carbohydrate metabolism regulator) [Neorhizobium galegae]